MRQKERGGDSTNHDRAMRALGKELTGDIAEATRRDGVEAATLVEDHLVGMRSNKGKSATAASPDARRILDERETPPLLPDWQTGNMRKQEQGGNAAVHDRNMRALGKELTGDIAQTTGWDKDEAAALVEHNLVGIRSNKSGPKTVAASPDARRILDERETPPLLPGWQTSGMRMKEQGGDIRTHDRNMRALGKELTGDIAQATGCDKDEAAALVEHNLVGMRQGKNGKPAMAASPDAQRTLDEQDAKSHAARLHRRRSQEAAPTVPSRDG